MNRGTNVRPNRIAGEGRRGITILEIVIIIGILAVLVSLLLPAVQQARTTSRNLHCKNNLRMLTLGLIQVTESKKRFPASGYFGKFGGDYHNWIVDILPWIDQTAVYDKWDKSKPFNSPENLPLGELSIPVLICPQDTTVAGKGDLSFVVNGGFGWTGPPCGIITPSNYVPIDLNGTGPCQPGKHKGGDPTDRELMYFTGLMFCENWPDRHPDQKTHNFDTIVDGTSNTIMMAENVHAGWDKNGNHGNWANPLSWRTCFFLSGHICEGFSCKSGAVDYDRANDRSTEPYLYEALNAPFQMEGAAPWPASFHTGGVNVAFCDGSIRFLSEELNGRVYASLVTPQGSRIKGPLAQPASGDEY